MPYYAKQQLKLTAVFEEGGVAVSPTTVVCKVISPSGVESTPAVIEDSTGHYHALLEPEHGGTWYYRFEGHTTHIGASEKAIKVEVGPFYS